MTKILSTIVLCLIVFISFGQNQKINVYITISEECPISIAMVEDLKDLQLRFQNTAKFTLVFPMITSDTFTAQQFVTDYELKGFDILVSSANNFCKKNELRITPEALVMVEEVVYRGRINNLYTSPGKKNHRANKYDLRDAIQQALSHESQKTNWPKAIGCTITYEQ